MEPFLTALGQGFHADDHALRRAVRQRSSVNLFHRATSTRVDLFIAGGSPLDRQGMQRRVRLQVASEPDRFLYVYTPEDILLQKLRWYRLGGEVSDRQWRDILGIVLAVRSLLAAPDLGKLASEACRPGILDFGSVHRGAVRRHRQHDVVGTEPHVLRVLDRTQNVRDRRETEIAERRQNLSVDVPVPGQIGPAGDGVEDDVERIAAPVGDADHEVGAQRMVEVPTVRVLVPRAEAQCGRPSLTSTVAAALLVRLLGLTPPFFVRPRPRLTSPLLVRFLRLAFTRRANSAGDGMCIARPCPRRRSSWSALESLAGPPVLRRPPGPKQAVHGGAALAPQCILFDSARSRSTASSIFPRPRSCPDSSGRDAGCTPAMARGARARCVW